MTIFADLHHGASAIRLADALAELPRPATAKWPDGVWDVDALVAGGARMSLFAPRGHDYQSAHDEDELYVVVSGAGVFEVAGARRSFAAGDLIFVPKGVVHRFLEFGDDLVTWVVWLPGDVPASASESEMTVERIAQFVQAWEDGDVERCMDFITDDCVYVTTTGPDLGSTYTGRAEVRAAFERLSGPDPVARNEFAAAVICGDRAFLEWSARSRADGTLLARGVDLFELRGDRVCRKDAFRKVTG